MSASLSFARAVADAVLYEGYLLYPYRASSQKNHSRWQFGLLGPPGAAAAGLGEESSLFADCVLRPGARASVLVHLRFLHLQTRTVERVDAIDFTPVPELTVNNVSWLSWDEAAERELVFGPFTVTQLLGGLTLPVDVAAGRDVELLLAANGEVAGRLVRRRRELMGTIRLEATVTDNDVSLLRVRLAVENGAATVIRSKEDAVAESFIGTHLLLSIDDGDFVSLLEPNGPGEQAAVAQCSQSRCWPVLAGPEGKNDVLLISPIILYDHPSLAPESTVALFDATEIDEILTLRVLTLTEEEKAEARATDPRAAQIIDRCEAMTTEQLQALHGALRDRDSAPEPDLFTAGDVVAQPGDDLTPWWDPAADASVQPDQDVVVIDGLPVSRGSLVTIRPKRRADAQDIFFAGEIGRVAGVHFDVDGSTHVAVLLEADPAADLHDWYGRYLYFAPDELEPLGLSERRDCQA